MTAPDATAVLGFHAAAGGRGQAQGMDHDNVRGPYPAALSFRFLARQLD